MKDGAGAGTRGWSAPGVGWAAGPLGAVQAAAREMSRQAALRARAVAAFAASRPASTDRQQGERGAMSAERWAVRPEVLRPVSEWAAQELSIALDITVQKAEAELARSLTLVGRLPRVLDALEGGLLHPDHLWSLIEHVAPIADDATRARVEAELLAWMAARGRVTTPAALGDRVRRVVARHNARDAARDLARALRARGITVRPERSAGLSALTVVCATPEAQALYRALSAHVDALEPEPGDARSRGEKLVDCLLDLVLRPGESERPPVQALLTIVASVHTALGGDALGEVDGVAVPAEMARQLARAFAGLDPVPVAADEDATHETDTHAAGDVAPADDPAVFAVFAEVREEPDDSVGGPVERAAAELGDADFDRWLDELVRQGFGDDPAPAPADPGWFPVSPPESAGWDPDPWPEREDTGGFGEPDGWDAGPWTDACAWLDDHDPSPPDPGAEHPPASPAATPGSG
ncbi:DUF222 domain-containing protein [Geodermatophilus sp. SYSU D01176]